MIELRVGTIGSGKSYHTLEDIITALRKGKYVISNFPLKFEKNHILNGMESRYMYIDDETLMGENGMKVLYKISKDFNFGEEEGSCLVVIDEAGNHFPAMDFQKDVQRKWSLFFTQSRKMGYDFYLITQDEKAINRTIRKCCEYVVEHRKANNIFPFKYLPWTIFMYVRYWNKTPKTRLSSESTIFVKRLAKMYDSHRMFANIDTDLSLEEIDSNLSFGNCIDPGERNLIFDQEEMKKNNRFLKRMKRKYGH